MSYKRRRSVPYGATTKASGYLEVRRKSDGSAVTPIPNPWRTWSDPLFYERLQGTQETESENHKVFKDHKMVLEGDVGGNFTMSKQYCDSPLPENVYIQWPWEDGDFYYGGSNRESRYSYRGPISIPWNHSWTFPPFASSSDIDLTFWGTKAVALTAPTNPVAQTAVALLEAYRDGLPHLVGHTLWRDKTLAAKNAGDEYLNYQFGWIPLLSDIKDFIHGIHVFDKRYNQFVRDSGRGVRRRMSFSPEVSYDETVVADKQFIGGPSYVALQFCYNNGSIVDGHYGRVIRSRETSVRRWFSGMFTYHAPSNFVPWQYGDVMSKARQVLGLDLTPDVVWSIAPWSWAVDWFSSTGDMIHNLTAYQQYGLVLRYGYIMEHSVVRDTYLFDGDLGLRSGSKFTGGPPPVVLTSERKLRRKATPFGFGIDLSTLSNTQKAIIAALGLSRVHL
jgi:hypothetical protein